jgi:hypothetical protein
VDTLGLNRLAGITAASVQDRDGARMLLGQNLPVRAEAAAPDAFSPFPSR